MSGKELSEDEGEVHSDSGTGEEGEEGEIGGGEKAELEEGEVDDDTVEQNKPICRFFGKGLCTWGNSCRFLHPGTIDKGLYTMFDPLPRPEPPQHAPQVKQGLLGHAPPNYPVLREGPETSWERGLRISKEMIKKSVVRKETDVDFEEKKMNLSLAQDEIDKENDYYVIRKPESDVKHLPVHIEEDPDQEEISNLIREKKKIGGGRSEVKLDPELFNRIHHHDKIQKRRASNDKELKRKKPRLSRSSSSSSRSSSSSSSSDYGNKKRFPRERSRSNSSGGSGFKGRVRKAPPRDDQGGDKPVRIAPPLPSNEEFSGHYGYSGGRSRPPFRRMMGGRGGHFNQGPVSHQQSYTGRPRPTAPPRAQPPSQQSRYYRSKFTRRSRSSSSSASSNSSKSKRRRSSEGNKRRSNSRKNSSTGSSSDTSSLEELPRKVQYRKEVVVKRESPRIEYEEDWEKGPVVEPVVKVTEKGRIKMVVRQRDDVRVNRDVVKKLGDFSGDEGSSPLGVSDEKEDKETPAQRSRREELLAQLKAVEEAIAKKRSKIDLK